MLFRANVWYSSSARLQTQGLRLRQRSKTDAAGARWIGNVTAAKGRGSNGTREAEYHGAPGVFTGG